MVRTKLPASVAEPGREYLIQSVLDEFAALHSGNAVRFGIGPLELAAWQEKRRGTTEDCRFASGSPAKSTN